MMFLGTLSVFSLCIFIANSDTRRFEKTEADRSTERYEVPQEIKQLVPIDFAAASLRESRLNIQKNRDRFGPTVNATLVKSAIVGSPRRVKSKKRPSNRSKPTKHKSTVKTRRKKPKRPEWMNARKSNRLDRNQQGYERLPEQTSGLPDEAAVFQEMKNATLFRDTIRLGDSAKLSTKLLPADVQQSLNALPEELVTIVRDDTDCNDDPETKLPDVRGPPCTLSHKWSTSSGDAWLSSRNSIFRNWTLFNN